MKQHINLRYLHNQWSSGSQGWFMVPTGREVDINLMNLLFTNLLLVPIYGIAHIHSVDYIVQHMHKEAQHHNEQNPCKNRHKIYIHPKITDGLQDGTNLSTYKFNIKRMQASRNTRKLEVIESSRVIQEHKKLTSFMLMKFKINKKPAKLFLDD